MGKLNLRHSFSDPVSPSSLEQYKIVGSNCRLRTQSCSLKWTPDLNCDFSQKQLNLLWRWIVVALLCSACAVVLCVGAAFSIVVSSGARSFDASKWMFHSVGSHSSLIDYHARSNQVPEPQEATYEVVRNVKGAASAHAHRLTPDGSVLTQEAIQALQAANHILIAGGKREKAKRLLLHAARLCPKSPDVWIQMGNFMEFYEDNLVEAESMYKKAYICDPQNSQARSLIKRTDPQVQEIYSAIYQRIDEKRNSIAQVPGSDPALRRVMKESYYLHIYHTNAIEGNSLSLLQTRSIIETGYVVPGKRIKEHTEVLGLHDALGYINATLVNKPGPITIDDLLEIHKRVLGYAEPHIAGVFRNHQVYIANHVPPAPDLIEQEMGNFFLWLKSESVSKLHPIELAGLAHYWLVHIHPFVDGNGRTARLLMNLILMQSGFPPVTINFSDRLAYYEFLQLGNEGDIRPFLRFVASCTERTLDTYLDVTDRNIPSSTNRSRTERKMRIESLIENSISVTYEIESNSAAKQTRSTYFDTDRESRPDPDSVSDKTFGPSNDRQHKWSSGDSGSAPVCPFEDEFCR